MLRGGGRQGEDAHVVFYLAYVVGCAVDGFAGVGWACGTLCPHGLAATTAMTILVRRHGSPHMFAQGIEGVRSSREAAGAKRSPG
jgi:hypothetical protein